MQLINKIIIKLGIFSLLFAYFTLPKQFARAQSTPPSGVTIPPDTPSRVEETIPKPRETPLPSELEPSKPPSLEVPSKDTPKVPRIPSDGQINLKKLIVLGNTVLKNEIDELIEKFKKDRNCSSNQVCPVSFEDLLTLRSDITQLYIDNDYITSGAFILNNQPLESGIIEIQVVEGELERIEISGLNKLQKNYVRSRLRLLTKPPLNRRNIEEALQLLQLDPLLERVDAELTAGTVPGKNTLQLELQEAPAFSAGVAINNNQSPAIGSLQGIIFANYNNLLGIGDQFSAEYGLTEGLNIYSLAYRVPLNARDGKFNIRYSNNDSKIVEEQFADFDIRSDSETLSFGFRQPLVKRPNTEFALGLTFDLRRTQTFIFDDDPFSFSEGTEDGESKVTVIRFSQDWLQRNATQVLAARSQFSFGIDAFDATINETGIDGRFFSWLGQFQWVQQISPQTLVVSKINAQLTTDALLPLEKISLGGVDTVRGYRQNQLVTDNAILGSVELRFPLDSDNSLQIRPFFDMGTAWNNKEENPDPKAIAALGLGLSWQPQRDLFLQLDYGIPLIADEEEGDSLQENGLYFSLRYQPF